FEGDPQSNRQCARLNPDGSRMLSFPYMTGMSRKMMRWNDRFYAGVYGRRLFDGSSDPDFPNLYYANNSFLVMIQGDQHVFPDGSTISTVLHQLEDPD